MVSEPKENGEERKGSQIGLKDVLTFLDMAMEEHPSVSLPLSADEIFEELTVLINETVQGTRIKRFRPGDRRPKREDPKKWSRSTCYLSRM